MFRLKHLYSNVQTKVQLATMFNAHHVRLVCSENTAVLLRFG